MKKACMVLFIMMLATSVAFGQGWNPTPMVIDIADVVQYNFDGTDIDVPFDLTGKPAQIWMVISTQLADEDKPVAVQNGFKGWHFVNGIDTTVFVSTARDYLPGNDQTFPWSGMGNEKEYENTVSSGPLAAGDYTIALIGYDNKSSREKANNFIAIGGFMQSQASYFYTKDDATGASLTNPLLMGKNWHKNDVLNYNNLLFKFQLGDDPYDASKITTSFVFGFENSDIYEGTTVRAGSGHFDPNDYSTYYFPSSVSGEWTSVNKVQFVPQGQAIEDTGWGGRQNVEWASGPGDSPRGIIQTDGERIFFNIGGKNPEQLQSDRVYAFPIDDPTDEEFEVYLDEFYAPNAVPDNNDTARKVSEAGRFDKGPEWGQFYMSGDASCVTELIDCNKMLDGSDAPFRSDGSGYVVWCNSNGDFFVDKNAQPEPTNPQQLWACNAYEPRNYNMMRVAPSESDMNEFMCDYLEFAGLYSCALLTPDGTGIGYVKFADDSFSAGGDNAQKKGNGYTLDVGGQFDGIYMLNPMEAEPSWGNAYYDGTNWIAWDSDTGLLTNRDVAVEDAAPAAFSVAQNSPNPFNPTTTINFTLARDGQVSIDVFNVAGQKVDTLVNDVMAAGSHTVTWDANGFAAGVYFYTVSSGDFSKTMKMTLLK